MPATTSEKSQQAGWAPKIFTVLALLGLPASLSSPGATISMVLLALYGGWLTRRHGGDDDLWRVFRWMAGCYLIVFVVDMINGGFVGNLISTGVNYLPLIALAPYAYAIRRLGIRPETVERVMQGTVLLATAATVYLAFFAGEHRPGGLNLNSIPFSLVVSIWGVILLSLGLNQGKAGIASILVALVAVVPVVLSGSKIALFCLIVGYFVAAVLWTLEGKHWRFLTVAIGLTVIAGIVLWGIGALSRVEEFFAEIGVFLSSGGLRGGSFGQRYQLLVASWQAFLERPLLGYGLNERMDVVFSHITGYDIGTKSLGHLHNDYTTHLVSYGIFGAVFLVAYFVGIWRFVVNSAQTGFAQGGVAIIAMLIIYMSADVAFNMDPITGATTVAFGLILAWAKPAPSASAPQGLQNQPASL